SVRPPSSATAATPSVRASRSNGRRRRRPRFRGPPGTRGDRPACARRDCTLRSTLALMKPFIDLTGRIALVTGASSGIGAATAIALAGLGARVALSYHRNQQGAEQTRDRILASGGTAMAVGSDVRRAEEVRALVDRAA